MCRLRKHLVHLGLHGVSRIFYRSHEISIIF